MTTTGPKLLAAMMLIGTPSCVQSVPQQTKAAPVPETAKPPAPSKPVLMNGRGKVTSVSIEELFTLQQSDNVLLFDARPGFFYTLGHIPGAISMPKPECDKLIAKHEGEIKSAVAAKKTIVVYCTNLLCPDARTVARHLASLGYSSSTLTGGWDSWKEAGLPTQ